MNSTGSSVKVGYLGPEGTYSHMAAQVAFGKGEAEFLPYDSIPVLLSAYESGKVQVIVIPFENGIGGDVTGVFGWLCKNGLVGKYQIIQELVLPIRHALLGVSGACLKDIKTVISKDNALMQCLRIIQERGWNQQEAESTAKAAWAIATTGNKTNAAIGPPVLAQMYGLEILSLDIMDNPRNYTRFFTLSSRPETLSDCNKAAMLLRFSDQVGSLVQRLVPFAQAGISLSRLTTWTSGMLGQYVFWVEIELLISDDLDKVLAELRSMETEVVELGRYPRWVAL